MAKNLKVGNEIKIITKDGKSFEGILMECKRGYLSTIMKLGIVLTIPLSLISEVIKIKGA